MLRMFAKTEKDSDKPSVRLVIFGLSHRNLELLREGHPIIFRGDTCGLEDDIEFIIFSEATETKMHESFREFITPDTKIDYE